MSKNIAFTLVFPCYLEEAHLEANVECVIETVSLLNVDYEIIFVDDCSPDGTREAIDRIIAKHSTLPIRKILIEKNLGRGAAFMTGFAASTGDIVGFFDIDLEVSAVFMLEALRIMTNQRVDLVVGFRLYKVTFSIFYRHLLSRCYRLLVAAVLGIPLVFDTESGYKFFRRDALQKYEGKFHYRGWFWDTEVVTRFYRDGLRVESFPCLFIRDGTKRSTVRPLHDSLAYLKNLFDFRCQLKSEDRARVFVHRQL